MAYQSVIDVKNLEKFDKKFAKALKKLLKRNKEGVLKDPTQIFDFNILKPVNHNQLMEEIQILFENLDDDWFFDTAYDEFEDDGIENLLVKNYAQKDYEDVNGYMSTYMILITTSYDLNDLSKVYVTLEMTDY